MAKRKKQTKKPSIAAILGMILLGLVAVGVVANVIKDNVKEEDPTQELGEVTIKLQGSGYEFSINYEDGMTWAEVAEVNDNIELSNGEDGYVTIFYTDMDNYVYLISGTPTDRTYIMSDMVVDLSLMYFYDTEIE